MYNYDSIVCELAGAIGVSGLEYFKEEIKGKNVVCIISGSNNDLSRMKEINNYSLMHQGLIYYMLVNFHLTLGSVKEFLTYCLGAEGELISMEYTRKKYKEKGPALVCIQVTKREHFDSISSRLQEKDISFKILTPDDDLFKLMV